ncbi:hypothetical protein JCM19038_2819 [Geomicrobium sp. JCM 19038]|nr:hypothetical protein JCM19038_2819 [Geomicrobium sp. JCM 19038]
MDFASQHEEMINVVIQERSMDRKQKLLDLIHRQKAFLYRDKYGRKMYGIIQTISETDVFWGNEIPLTIQSVYYDEEV